MQSIVTTEPKGSSAGRAPAFAEGRRAHSCILICGLLLTLPAILAPQMLHDSFWIDWVWADQFNTLLRAGTLYPRWLPMSHGGLGSPVFYYYPPGAFYLTGFFGLLGFPAYASIIAAFGAALILSGYTMYNWLKGWAAHPLFGALLFMAAPYHMLDFYRRGALAEFVAILFLPLVALGLRRIAEGRGLLLAAVAYAALIATHLPLALLVSLFFMAPYALVLNRRQPAQMVRTMAAGLLGIGLASIYLVPALAMASYRDADFLWSRPNLLPENWTFIWAPSPLATWGMMQTFQSLILTYAIAALVLIALRRCGWSLAGLIVLALMAGAVPGLWTLPLLETAQFPFRALPIAEFALITALVRRPLRLPLVATFAPPLALTACVIFLPAPPAPDGFTPATLARDYPDVPENLAQGRRTIEWHSQWALELAGSAKRIQRDGVTIEPVFYFPTWRVVCDRIEVQTFPAPETHLLAYRGGGHCKRELRWTFWEKLGAALSGCALLILGLLVLRGNRTIKAQSARLELTGLTSIR